jgi:hypothetical protein
MTLAQQKGLSLEDAKALWRVHNRGVLQQIAADLDVSYSFVQRVFKGELKSRHRRVELALQRRGCPGFEKIAA